MKNVPFTTDFIKEVMRLSHIIEFIVPREALVDLQLPNGLIMPEGTQYAVDLIALQLSEARFRKTLTTRVRSTDSVSSINYLYDSTVDYESWTMTKRRLIKTSLLFEIALKS